ncbi:polymorphic toxin type 50 domain-containing protein [Trinickia caryophylli]|uniref:polymorphic toxin type 50 domain-containing protein n=1 Tax=Trinickia caryophylli TaxID=28094 RepID=UPI0018EAF538|nr:polymorphic toxin type 50 domain-containing protein [Trinickia caryophylli]WQE15363.1 hypothetical protein U0034_22810 [Trinickia caryophylli]
MILQGIRNGLGGILFFEGGGPFTPSGGTVLVNSGLGHVANASVGTVSREPGNATFAENGGGSDTPEINAGKQGKHQPDHNNFTPGRSELSYLILKSL